MDLSNVTPAEVRDFIIAFAAFVAALGVISRPFFNAFDKRIDARLTPIRDELHEVRHEVQANDGSSLKDVATSTRSEVRILTARFNDHLFDHATDGHDPSHHHPSNYHPGHDPDDPHPD